jgi:hypothetical protein
VPVLRRADAQRQEEPPVHGLPLEEAKGPVARQRFLQEVVLYDCY